MYKEGAGVEISLVHVSNMYIHHVLVIYEQYTVYVSLKMPLVQEPYTYEGWREGLENLDRIILYRTRTGLRRGPRKFTVTVMILEPIGNRS